MSDINELKIILAVMYELTLVLKGKDNFFFLNTFFLRQL